MSRRCSIDADLSCDAVAHRLEAAYVPEDGRAPAHHSLPVFCSGGSEALPFAVFSSRTSLTRIGGATHASRGAHTPSWRAFAARASTTRRVAKLGGGCRQIGEAVTQVRARARLRRGQRRCSARGSVAAVRTRRRAWRFLDDAGRRSRFATSTAEHREQSRRRPPTRQRCHIGTLASLVAKTGGVHVKRLPECARAPVVGSPPKNLTGD
jgi:hypothetical protein